MEPFLTTVAIGIGIAVVLYPFLLHRASQKLERPEVVFRAHWWRIGWETWVLNGSALVGMVLFVKQALSPLTSADAAWAYLVIVVLLALPLWVTFRLHRSYWLHDQFATLVVSSADGMMWYSNQGAAVEFTYDEVTAITWHVSRYSRSVWSDYEYLIIHLQNGHHVLITCLLYSLLGPEKFLPNVPFTREEHRICWLP